jgi:uncharacterized protein YndB with AHSA1/START domain
MNTQPIMVSTTVNAPVEKAWEYFTDPAHVTQWNQASDDWHSPRGTNDLKIGGTFSYRMEAKDGSAGFDFAGTYSDVVPHERFAYAMDDGRTVTVTFEKEGDATKVIETFDPETEHSVDMQRDGWQAILDSYKRYVETH